VSGNSYERPEWFKVGTRVRIWDAGSSYDDDGPGFSWNHGWSEKAYPIVALNPTGGLAFIENVGWKNYLSVVPESHPPGHTGNWWGK
jgi:hypothetical protein